jgi:nucleoside-diphosphate-sugar epimerase
MLYWRISLSGLPEERRLTREKTVRDTKNEAKIAPIKKAFGEYFEKLELVNADLLDAESITKAIAGSTYILHQLFLSTSQKRTKTLSNQQLMVTVAVIHACSASGGVKRCVITSSVAAHLICFKLLVKY